MSKPNRELTDRYEKWLDQCALEFKNQAHVKAELIQLIDRLRLEEDEVIAPIDPAYKAEYLLNSGIKPYEEQCT